MKNRLKQEYTNKTNPLQRITDFPNEFFEERNSELYCSVCKKFIQTRKMASIKARVRT